MWELSEKTKIPIYQQIMEQIISYIQEGTLQPGDRLPSERKLATYYNVNRSTVVHALDELVSLGWVLRRQGSGTIVNEGNWGRSTMPRVDWRSFFTQESHPREPFLEKLQLLLSDSEALDLYSGELPLNLIPDFRFPSYTWEELLLEERKQSALGYRPLQQIICQKIKIEQKIDVFSDQVLITSGAQQAMFLLLQVMLQSGDSVAIEDPSFLYSLPIFATAGIKLYGVEMDNEGIKIDKLEQLILTKKIKLIILNPTFQNPTGKTMSESRRRQLIELSQKYQLPIVEDEVFSEMNFNLIPPSLKELAPHQVIHLGSLSKIFGSSIKIGWIVADRDLIQRLSEAKQMMDFSISVFPQVIAHTALTDSQFERNQKELVSKLKKRANLFVSLADSISEDWIISKIEGGIYVYFTWRHQKLFRKDWEIFLREKILIAPAFLFSSDTMAMRVNYTRLSEKAQQLFFEKLQKISRELRRN
ncbi:aminotransferase-like domain-containing protein [Enterococcus raffinosus]|uniref:PLP-dependent aminotransferase family protein n=1 Tax=Enterococcus raffinosus TaxID=71452 RepID=A0AAW8TBU7_9ENTE|nr:PLP-dependent aminotransferase family protein [Enterococcus raffinosus]MDT2522829.1 PLP-dependent aminotransferase family protein [Enterococcus raffinosus]MDT2530715.1 PLP-dependent aminotransferase family protein [Enterococcus raffinosus]MDT2532484.1 PLP-dependent aminotransferase family protein [Enterococcus raffinosus]MDT2544318.1 PLP-dependent aminotransferase family protein [Enterococcus raffinosus]MDT2554441.1 PLP-dependent aminotransferase family protein [Enterococcus raffinosus]